MRVAIIRHRSFEEFSYGKQSLDGLLFLQRAFLFFGGAPRLTAAGCFVWLPGLRPACIGGLDWLVLTFSRFHAAPGLLEIGLHMLRWRRLPPTRLGVQRFRWLCVRFSAEFSLFLRPLTGGRLVLL